MSLRAVKTLAEDLKNEKEETRTLNAEITGQARTIEDLEGDNEILKDEKKYKIFNTIEVKTTTLFVIQFIFNFGLYFSFFFTFSNGLRIKIKQSVKISSAIFGFGVLVFIELIFTLLFSSI